MAAPFRSVYRPLWRMIKGSGRLTVGTRSIYLTKHQFCAKSHKTVSVASPWALHGAVCLQRLPAISQDRSPIEEEFMELMQQMELERSLLSDHELRLLEDAARMTRKQEQDYDSDEEEDYGDKEIVTAQDLEDSWEQKLKQFHPAQRSKDVDKLDVGSSERCLADSLILLVKQDVGSQKIWLLPQIQWQDGETLRQTAERALAYQAGADLKATFLGNAPCGFYKHKYPKDIQKDGSVGAKVFFFKAVMCSLKHVPMEKNSYAWVKKDELQDYLKPGYLKQVNRFIMNL